MSFTARSSVRESFGGGACLFLSVVPSEEVTALVKMGLDLHCHNNI